MSDQNPIPEGEISVLILAGGRGSRMDGRDKGLMPVAGKPAIEHVLERILPQSQKILVSANRNLERYSEYGYPVLTDAISGFAGPLAGFLSGLMACNTPYLLTLPVDSPMISPNYLVRMRTFMEAGRPAACVAEYNGRMEPVFSLLRKDMEVSLRDYLNQGKRSVQDWMEQIGAQRVDCSDTPEQFININSAPDQQRVEEQLKR